MSNATVLTLCLHASIDTLPAGQTVKAKGGAQARLTAGQTQARLDIALPEKSRADLRWIFDQIVRKARDLCSFESVDLQTSGNVSPETRATLGLDLHNAFAGRITLNGDKFEAISKVGPLEDGFRAWVNEDPAERTSIAIARDIREWAEQFPSVSVDVYEEAALKELKLNLLLAVGGASIASPPRLVIAKYTPGGSEKAPLMLLGKGITFDSGGINVKPYEAFVSHMKNDMAGSALAYWLFRGLVEQGHPDPLLLVIPTCENPIGENAMRPGALVKSHRGHVVRIDHTDAEGRLILADALSYATSRYKPEHVLCFATLTTAALVSYGPYATPVHFADAEWESRLREASEITGEDLHFFPERVWHLENNRDLEADLRNTARFPGDAGKAAGSRNAAHFLKFFTDAPLIHFDIFASTWNWAGGAPGARYGATGAPLRTLLRAAGAKR